MLILTPTPPQTAAERAFFAELASWDTGGGVRGAVMAALPIVEGPMDRRQSDAVLFVPEGVAVVRVVEVERQSGVVTATPEGSWTIGSGDGPGDVLQLAGGGSSPLDGLMRAGMHAAITLRKAGLEPGRVARLTVLTGAVTGLLPADGDLGEGDQVAVLDARSLLLGVARAARHAGTDNPRLWTTADVRAGIDALGVGGRMPSVEELNGEGFPYSPYVLRRQELLTPAALNAAPTRTAAVPALEAAPAPAPVPEPPRPAAGGPLVDPAAAGRLAAAAVQAQEQAERASAAPAAQPPAPPAQHGASGGGHRAPEVPVPSTARPGDTLALIPEPPVAGHRAPAADTGLVPPRPSADDTGGIGGLFSGGPAPAQAPEPRRELPPELQPRRITGPPPAPRGSSAVESDDPPARRRGLLFALVAAGLALVLALVVGGVLLLSNGDDDDTSTDAGAGTSEPAQPVEPTGPAVGDTTVVDGVTFTLQATQTDTTCQEHAYDAVADFFATSECAGLARSLWSAETGGQPAVVSFSRVTMPDVASAQALRSLADTDGSGNVSDLLREGVRYDGGPTSLSRAQYASTQQGATVTIVETSWTGTGAGATSALDSLASTALTLPVDDTAASD